MKRKIYILLATFLSIMPFATAGLLEGAQGDSLILYGLMIIVIATLGKILFDAFRK